MPQTQIVCHRGAKHVAPENTLASAEAALTLGGSVIELDVRQSADGVLYVMHDETVDRTTNGKGSISELQSSEIDQLDAGSWFDARFAGERVPRLETFLRALAPRAGFYLEIKHADCEAVGRLVRHIGIASQCFTFSFDPEMRDQMRLKAPEIARMIHWTTAGSVEAARNGHSAAIVEFHEHDFDPSAIRACQDAGLKVMFYTDKPDMQRFQTALELGMDFVNIDHIADFADLRRRIGQG